MTIPSLAQNETPTQIKNVFDLDDSNKRDYGTPVGWVSLYGRRKIDTNSGVTHVMISAYETEEFCIPLYIHQIFH